MLGENIRKIRVLHGHLGPCVVSDHGVSGCRQCNVTDFFCDGCQRLPSENSFGTGALDVRSFPAADRPGIFGRGGLRKATITSLSVAGGSNLLILWQKTCEKLGCGMDIYGHAWSRIMK